LATALGMKACEVGGDVRFYRVADLVAQLEEALERGTLQRMKRSIESCDLLILDELCKASHNSSYGKLNVM
jgi:DNA replication protein DnaC